LAQPGVEMLAGDHNRMNVSIKRRHCPLEVLCHLFPEDLTLFGGDNTLLLQIVIRWLIAYGSGRKPSGFYPTGRSIVRSALLLKLGLRFEQIPLQSRRTRFFCSNVYNKSKITTHNWFDSLMFLSSLFPSAELLSF
jgi:hypothetical protein